MTKAEEILLSLVETIAPVENEDAVDRAMILSSARRICEDNEEFLLDLVVRLEKL